MMKQKCFLFSILFLLALACNRSKKEDFESAKLASQVASTSVMLEKKLNFILDLIKEKIKDSDFEKAIFYSNQLIEESKDLKDKDGEAWGYYEKGFIYDQSLKLYDSAIINYYQSLQLRKETGNMQRMNDSYQGIASSYYNLQFFDKAKEYYELLRDNAKLSGDKASEAKAYLGIASCHTQLQHSRDVVVANYKKCLVLSEELNDQVGIGECYNLLGAAYYYIAPVDLDQAKIYYTSAASIFKSHAKMQELGDVYLNLALLHTAAKETKEAISYFQSVLNLGNTTRPHLLIRSHLELGDIHNIQKKYSEAVKELEQAKELATVAHHSRLLSDINALLSEVYLKINHSAEAIRSSQESRIWQTEYNEKQFQASKLIENQRLAVAHWEETRMNQKESISAWIYVLAIVISFVIGGGSVLTWTYIRTKKSTSIVQGDHQEKKENIEYKEITNEIKQDDHIQTTETTNEDIDDPIKSLTNRLYRILLHQFHTNEWIEKESMEVYTEAKEMEKTYKSKPDASLYRNELKDIRYIVRNSKWFLVCLKEQDKTKKKLD